MTMVDSKSAKKQKTSFMFVKRSAHSSSPHEGTKLSMTTFITSIARIEVIPNPSRSPQSGELRKTAKDAIVIRIAGQINTWV